MMTGKLRIQSPQIVDAGPDDGFHHLETSVIPPGVDVDQVLIHTPGEDGPNVCLKFVDGVVARALCAEAFPHPFQILAGEAFGVLVAEKLAYAGNVPALFLMPGQKIDDLALCHRMKVGAAAKKEHGQFAKRQTILWLSFGLKHVQLQRNVLPAPS